MSTSIGKQAENYAEVITGQIVANFDELATAMLECKELKDAKKAYEKTSPLDNAFTTIDTLQERVKIIEDNLGDIVCDEYNSIEPLAVGLFGEWGSGKTHQLKLIKKHLLSQTREEDASTIIPVFFNAWRFEKEEHIILPLFQTLLDAVENYERTLKGKAKRGFKSTAYHLKNVLFSLHHGIGWASAYKTVRGVVTNNLEDMREIANVVDVKAVQDKGKEKTNKEQVGEQSISQLLQPDQLQSIYLNIPQWIEKITLFEKVNFVFLIDDLDRCLPENTLKMLESIKLFLDVPSCAFVLAVDDDVVERGVVHHYRDYLSIYHHKDIESSQSAMQYELPITGHEYLEKMIQLPMRLPVIDTVNVREFLKECSQGWITLIDKKNNPEGFRTTTMPITRDKELDSKEEFYVSPTEKLLDFFAESIPPKPRKIKRTAKLFETKLRLLEKSKLLEQVDYMFVAKLTLLELFVPKLLRFIQNNGYGLIFNTLCHFRDVGYMLIQERERQYDSQNQPYEPREKYQNSLMDNSIILDYIEKPIHIDDEGYTTKERNTLNKVMHIVEEHYASRIVFDLDVVFDKSYDTEKLKLILELQESKQKKVISDKLVHFTDEFYTRLFRGGDVDAWKDVLSEHKVIISYEQLEELIEKAKEKRDKTFNNLPFIANPEWVGQIANFVDDESYITLLKASHDARFKRNFSHENVEIDMFQMTFSEYDLYCKQVGIIPPSDKGWGRGNKPIVDVTKEDAMGYITWLNKNLGNWFYVLPTERNWEDACTLGKSTLWHFGESGQDYKKYAWFKGNSDGRTHKVGQLIPNEIGLYDMHGNVWEFIDTNTTSIKVKGGSWYEEYYEVSTKDTANIKLKKGLNLGFRLLRTPQ